jgi:hypothetical protein
MKNISEEIYSDGTEITIPTPREAKGGAIAPADVPLIKKILLATLSDENPLLTTDELRQAAHLVHRLGRIA